MAAGRLVVACFAAALGLPVVSIEAGVQAQPTLVAGQVLDAVSTRPVSDVVVTLSVSGSSGLGPAATAAQRKVLTDGSGRFAFQGLPAGRYSITATRPGYVTGSLGKLVPRGGGAPLQLRDGERATDLRILVWKHAALRGRVTDEAGEPVVAARVTVLRRALVSGRSGYTSGVTATTDDRGEYRASGLEPGTYVVGVLATSTTLPLDTVDEYNAASGEARTELQRTLFAAAPTMTSLGTAAHQVVGDHLLQVEGRLVGMPDVARDGTVRIYPTAFHGGASQIGEAEVVSVAAGEQRAGIDVPLRLTRVFRVSGMVATTEGPARPTPILLWPASLLHANPEQPVASTVSDSSGRFTLLAIPPGQYLIRAINDPPARVPGSVTASTLWVSEPVTVADRDVTSMELTLQAGFRVAGRIVFEGDALPVPMNRMFVNLESVDRTLVGEFSEIQAALDGTFRSVEAPTARYRLTLPLPSGWFVKSITSSGRPLDDLPFELKEALSDLVITVSSRGAQITGTVRTAAGAPDSSASVIAFPVDSRQWIDFSAYARGIKEERTGRDGAFRIADLPEGDYLIVALPQQQLDWTQAKFFETLSRLATRLTLGAGEARALDLRTVNVKW
jgi:protocatechuate 3,4-dioxygenase beta subunit